MDGLALPAAGCDNAWPIDGKFGRSLFGLSLCAGAGGLDLGIHLTVPEYRTVGYIERDTYAAATLVARMEDTALDCAPVWDNVADFDGRPWSGVVDIIHGGYPCQPFSVAGLKRGDKDPRHLWPHIARIVREIEPSICFFENVGGHLRLGFEQVHDDLRSMGYRIKAGLFTAEEVGAPHKRERLFILAYRESLFCEWRFAERSFGGQPENEIRSERGVVANSDSNRRQSEMCPQPRQDDPQRSTECAADTGAGRNGIAAGSLSLQQGGFGAGETREALSDSAGVLADPACAGARQHQLFARDIAERGQQDLADAAPVQREEIEWHESYRTPTTVGDADRTGLEGRCVERKNSANEWFAFPPGPADRSGWERVLEHAPHIEPAVRGGADGLAYRVDRLRLCGNGVVPLVAAYAFRTLCAAAGISISDITSTR